MILSPYREGAPTVARLRASATVDSYGDAVLSWASPTSTPIPGADVQTRTATEDTASARPVVREETVLFAPGAVDLTAADRVSVDGDVYTVDGKPEVRYGLGSEVYTVAALKRASGGAR